MPEPGFSRTMYTSMKDLSCLLCFHQLRPWSATTVTISTTRPVGCCSSPTSSWLNHVKATVVGTSSAFSSASPQQAKVSKETVSCNPKFGIDKIDCVQSQTPTNQMLGIRVNKYVNVQRTHFCIAGWTYSFGLLMIISHRWCRRSNVFMNIIQN